MERNTVLIVDDEEMNLRVLSAILCEEYDVQTASSGQAAIEMALKDPPDLILLDVMMPGMDGYETLKALKKNEKTWNIPVIYITGLDSEKDEEKGLEMNAADYISKPFSVNVVKLRVKNQLQIVNQIRTIEALSLIDQLTGIPNRRNLDNRFTMEWTRAFREKQPISLLMIDIDKFKVFNDTYGHLVGDNVLKMVAESFECALKRKSDFAARFGGEEFSVLLPNTSVEGAIDVAENIRKGVEQLAVPCGDGKTTTVTLSIGIYTAIPSDGEEIGEIISKADQALYAAKAAGRNRVCVYDMPAPAGMPPGETPPAVGSAPPASAPAAPSSAPAAPSSAPAAPDTLSLIGNVDGINLEAGLSHFNTMEDIYVETVGFFCQRVPEIINEMDSALETGDIKRFTISVHSLKSMLSTVGATGISRMAAKLEAAGKNDDVQLCRANYPGMREKLAALQDGLSRIFTPVPADATKPDASAAAAEDAGETARKKIIHVDDVTYTLVSLKGRLEKYYEIYSVRSHKQLFKLLNNITPDMILLDVKMPGMDGYEIISELKADSRFKSIPVVFLTSVSDDESIEKCRQLGAADIIIKPIPDAELVRRISETINAAQ